MSNKVRVYADVLKQQIDADEDTLDAMEALGEEIAAAAMERIEQIFESHGGPPNDFEIIVEPGRDTRGYFFIIQTDGGGRISAYLDKKEEDEPGSWMSRAVGEVIGHEGVKVDWSA